MVPTLAHPAHLRKAWLIATIAGIGALYVGSTLLTPLYPLYERAFDFPDIAVAEIYAVYVVGNLLVLFFFGRLSDQIGRRRVVLAAFAVTVLSTVCFLAATSAAWLFVGRAVNGFGVGLGAGALTAWIDELEPNQDHARAAVLASTGNLIGLATGTLSAGLLATLAPWPLRTSFVAYLAALAVVIACLWRIPDVVDAARPRSGVSLRPRIGVPRDIRLAFVSPAALAFGAFALGGFYAALAPGLLGHVFHETRPVVVGGIVALFFFAAAATVPVTRRIQGSAAAWTTLILLLTGLSSLLVAETTRSLALLVVASVVSGAAMALGYRGSLQVVNDITPDDKRAEVVSSYLLVCFSANSLPVIGVGVLAQFTGAVVAHRAFAGLLAVLAIIGCVAGSHSRRKARDRG